MSGSRKYVRHLSTLVTFSVATLVVAACAPTSAPSGAVAQSNHTDSVLTVGLPGSLSTLDVAHEAGILNYYVAQVSSEGLLGVDTEGKIVPALAEKWETTDGRTWVFTLREGAKFQDGTQVTTDDVLFSLDIARDPERSPSTAVYWAEGTQVEKTGEREITITLPEPSVNFDWTVTASGGLWITSRAFYEAAQSYGSSSDLIMGTGPYRAVEFQADSHATFERVDTWWGKTNEKAPKKIEFDFFSDESTRLLAQQSGKLDISLQIPASQQPQYEALSNTQVTTVTDRSYVGLTFDTAVAPFDDIHVRRAIAYAVDRNSIVSSVLNGKGEVATSIESPEQLGSHIGVESARSLIAQNLADIQTASFDMEAARAELAQSVVPQGFSAELLYPTSIPELGTAALAIAENLKSLGIELTVTGKPVEQWITTLGTGEYGLSYMSYTPTTGDPAEITGWLLGESNPARYSQSDVRQLITEQAGEVNDAARATKILEATKIALNDVIYSPIWWGKNTTAFASRVLHPEINSYFFMSGWASQIGLTDSQN
ncbi:ABC transporter substrate-binding protein [Schaalia sp. lx-100]|uniref:ABC transporter substrate-binding protein n=1 Tax=Schaalia sp. lx-100 TaxID=2899081 RepID=UPI001E364DAC|nr:ABC transporter substrate-binding protein [Schaalia sp. lx-100]MCD4556683.1 ABC transporter substrate-binding protein [Schaalia sp. lx-100]